MSTFKEALSLRSKSWAYCLPDRRYNIRG